MHPSSLLAHEEEIYIQYILEIFRLVPYQDFQDVRLFRPSQSSQELLRCLHKPIRCNFTDSTFERWNIINGHDLSVVEDTCIISLYHLLFLGPRPERHKFRGGEVDLNRRLLCSTGHERNTTKNEPKYVILIKTQGDGLTLE